MNYNKIYINYDNEAFFKEVIAYDKPEINFLLKECFNNKVKSTKNKND